MNPDPIADLVHRYADAVVNRNEADWAATWTADAVWELGQGRRMEGIEAIVGFWNSAMDGFKAVVQNVVNGSYVINPEGTTGAGRWYIIEHWQRTDDSRGILLAHYDDLYKPIDGEWYFASRQLVVHYAGPPDLSAPFLNAWG